MAGFAARAGKVVAGEQGVCLSAVSGKAKLVLLASDTSAHTTETVLRSCAGHVPVWRVADEDPGYHCGKSGRKVLAILDKGFAQRIEAAIAAADDGTLQDIDRDKRKEEEP